MFDIKKTVQSVYEIWKVQPAAKMDRRDLLTIRPTEALLAEDGKNTSMLERLKAYYGKDKHALLDYFNDMDRMLNTNVMSEFDELCKQFKVYIANTKTLAEYDIKRAELLKIIEEKDKIQEAHEKETREFDELIERIKALKKETQQYLTNNDKFETKWNMLKTASSELYNRVIESNPAAITARNNKTAFICLLTLGLVLGVIGTTAFFLPFVAAGFFATTVAIFTSIAGLVAAGFALLGGAQRDPVTEQVTFLAGVVLIACSVAVWSSIYSGLLAPMPIIGLVLAGIAAALLIGALATFIASKYYHAKSELQFKKSIESELTSVIKNANTIKNNPKTAPEDEVVDMPAEEPVAAMLTEDSESCTGGASPKASPQHTLGFFDNPAPAKQNTEDLTNNHPLLMGAP